MNYLMINYGYACSGIRPISLFLSFLNQDKNASVEWVTNGAFF